MRRVQHLLIAPIVANVAPHLHAHSLAKSAAVSRIAHRASIPAAMIVVSHVQMRAATTVVLRLAAIEAAQRTAVSAHRVPSSHRVQMQDSQAVRTVAQPLVIARRAHLRIVNRVHSAVTAKTVRSVTVLRAPSAATVTNVHLARPRVAVLSTHHALVSTVSRVIARHAPNTRRVPSVRTLRHAQSSQHRAQNATSVTNNVRHVAVTAP
jgi:hypothetical protein